MIIIPNVQSKQIGKGGIIYTNHIDSNMDFQDGFKFNAHQSRCICSNVAIIENVAFETDYLH